MTEKEEMTVEKELNCIEAERKRVTYKMEKEER